MKKVFFLAFLAFGWMQQAQAQEVKTDIEIVNEIKTVFMTVNADRFHDLKDFDWRRHLTEVFRDIPEEATIGIRVNIGAKQLGNDVATLNNRMSLQEIGPARNREAMLRRVVYNVQDFIQDEQQGNNIETKDIQNAEKKKR